MQWWLLLCQCFLNYGLDECFQLYKDKHTLYFPKKGWRVPVIIMSSSLSNMHLTGRWYLKIETMQQWFSDDRIGCNKYFCLNLIKSCEYHVKVGRYVLQSLYSISLPFSKVDCRHLREWNLYQWVLCVALCLGIVTDRIDFLKTFGKVFERKKKNKTFFWLSWAIRKNVQKYTIIACHKTM